MASVYTYTSFDAKTSATVYFKCQWNTKCNPDITINIIILFARVNILIGQLVIDTNIDQLSNIEESLMMGVLSPIVFLICVHFHHVE